MCSVCGKRSNWKWDVTKHIRSSHVGHPDARVIELSFDDLENLASVAAAAAAAASTTPPTAGALVSIPSSSPSAPSKFGVNKEDSRSISPDDSDAHDPESAAQPPPPQPPHQLPANRSWDAEAGLLRQAMTGASVGGAGGYVVNKSGHLTKDGGFRKLHRCKYCPYTNVRKVNLQLHEKMHGRNVALDGKDLIQCPYCDYTVGNKGLLSHHMKVHMEKPNIYEDADPSILSAEQIASAAEAKFYLDTLSTAAAHAAAFSSAHTPPKSVFPDSHAAQSDDDSGEDKALPYHSSSAGDRVPRFFCIRCPFSTENHIHYQRHLEMHGSQQKFCCSQCDYSVGTSAQLEHHKRLHDLPLPSSGSEEAASTSGYATSSPGVSSHEDRHRDDAHSPASPSKSRHDDHEEDDRQFVRPRSIHYSAHSARSSSPLLSSFDERRRRGSSPLGGSQAFKCERCPFVDARRAVLMAHLKCHVTPSTFTCPVCGYAVPQQHLLAQHLPVHAESHVDSIANNLNNVVVLGVDDLVLDEDDDGRLGRPLPSTKASQSPSPNHSSALPSAFAATKYSATHDRVSVDGPMDLSSKPKSRPSSDSDGEEGFEERRNPYSVFPHAAAPSLKDSIKELRHFAKHSVHSAKGVAPSAGGFYNRVGGKSTELGAQTYSPRSPLRPPMVPTSVTASQLEFAREHLVKAATALAASHAAASTSEMLQSQRNAAFKDASLSLAQAALVSRQHPALALGEVEGEESGDTMWVCQFCDIGFTASSKLVQHEMEHLMGKIKS